jgi:hypothetical protein
MTDRSKKISELTPLVSAAPEDLLVIVDSPSGVAETKKITVANFFGNVASNAQFKASVSVNGAVNITNTIFVNNVSYLNANANVRGVISVNGLPVINSSGYWVGNTSGLKGEKGDQGLAGNKGDTGAAGNKGDKGDKGEVGATGLTGATGNKGDTGSTGVTGAKGDIGSQGPQGPQGVVGGISYSVTANSGLYYFSGLTGSNPTLSLIRGFTYYFNISASGHPFWIKTVQETGTGNSYSTGVTNNGTDNGTVIFTVPSNAPSTLYYNCQYHSSMAGTINIDDVGPQGPAGNKGDKGNKGDTSLVPGPYDNDTAAQAAGVNVGGMYYNPSGVVYVRLN